jgi:AraC-like DNA-binding protein
MSWTGFRASRCGEMLADGNDNLNLLIHTDGTGQYRQLGRETVVGSNEAILISSAEAAHGLSMGASRSLMISAPREAIVSMVRNPEAMLCRTFRRTEMLRLIVAYVQSTDGLSLEAPGLDLAFVTHIQDLVVLALGAAGDDRELARRRGLRAARLVAIKLDVRRLLGRADLSVATVALRHGVTPRSVQKLFETEGTTFTAYVVERRLTEAKRMLADPQLDDHGIGDIALRCGFGDIPHFTRSFRRHFGMTPSDAREKARRERS